MPDAAARLFPALELAVNGRLAAAAEALPEAAAAGDADLAPIRLAFMRAMLAAAAGDTAAAAEHTRQAADLAERQAATQWQAAAVWQLGWLDRLRGDESGWSRRLNELDRLPAVHRGRRRRLAAGGSGPGRRRRRPGRMPPRRRAAHRRSAGARGVRRFIDGLSAMGRRSGRGPRRVPRRPSTPRRTRRSNRPRSRCGPASPGWRWRRPRWRWTAPARRTPRTRCGSCAIGRSARSRIRWRSAR
ncbi:MAG: hypothetical protein U0470_06730 [Anaerolineae bacterium]